MRLFFGLDLDADAALEISSWCDQQLICDGNPVSSANFHLTLAFLGNLDNSTLERLCQSVDQWLADGPDYADTLTLDCTGYWQNTGIHWLGPTSWPTSLDTMARKLRSLGTGVGAKLDRKKFRPHVTLHRRCIVVPAPPAVAPKIEFAYAHLCLFESIQGRNGVSYRILEDWPLHRAKLRTGCV